MKTFSLLLAALAVASGVVNAQRNASAIVDILSYNDVYEMLQDTVNGLNIGGPSRIVPIATEMRAKNPNSLVLFAGDTMSPSLWSSQFKGMQMVDAHNAIGTDFGCLGNHEFDFGLEGFWNVSNATNFVWLNSNVYENSTGELLRNTQANAVKTLSDPEFGTIKIGLFGILYNMHDDTKGIYWEDPITAAKEQVDYLLNDEKVDFVIALTHQDLADDNELSSSVEGIDIIFAGHDHAAMLQTDYGTPYLKADFDFRSIWKTRMEYFAATSSLDKTTRFTYSNIPITEDMPTDSALDEIISDYSVEIGILHSKVVGTLCEALDLSNKLVRAADAAVGTIFANAMLTFYGEDSADVSVMNGGGIRTDTVYPAGSLTVGQLIAWSPFGNTLMITETDGKSLKALVTKEMLGSCGDGFINLNGLYVHPGGFKYTFKCTGSGVGTITSIEWHDHPTRTGELLDTDVFKLALSNYIYNIEFAVISGITTSQIVHESEASRIDTALQDYVEAQPGAVLCIKADGRSSVSF